jgi:flavin-dependent dehydrogenase
MDKIDIAIIGGGISGLIAAIHIKELSPERRVTVLEERSYPNKDMTPMLLTPLARHLLHNISSYKNFNFNEGRYTVMALKNYDRNVSMETEDTAIIPYSNIVYVLYQIAVMEGVEIFQKRSVTAIDYNNRIISIGDEWKLSYKMLINATGMSTVQNKYKVKIDTIFIDEDLQEYPLMLAEKATAGPGVEVHLQVKQNLPKSADSYYSIGDANGYVDHLTHINCNLAIISGIYAAENICNNNSIAEYYSSMDAFKEHILASIHLRSMLKSGNDEINAHLKNIILYGAETYVDLYRELK